MSCYYRILVNDNMLKSNGQLDSILSFISYYLSIVFFIYNKIDCQQELRGIC